MSLSRATYSEFNICLMCVGFPIISPFICHWPNVCIKHTLHLLDLKVRHGGAILSNPVITPKAAIFYTWCVEHGLTL